MSGKVVAPGLRVQERIQVVRGQRVILDADLAGLYGTTTRRLNEQVRRNPGRFPSDFMFRLSPTEKSEVVANCDHLQRLKFSPSMPFAFTEHGAVMAASILNSPEAVDASVFVVRAFIAMRDALATNRALAAKLAELEKRVGGHDETIEALVAAIRQLMESPVPRRRRIGFGGGD